MAAKGGVGNTSNKTIRLADDLWLELQESAGELGTTASAWIAEAVRWHLRRPGVRLPQRALVPQGRGRRGVEEESAASLALRLAELLAEQEA